DKFHTAFVQAQHDGCELFTYARLRCKADMFGPNACTPPPPAVLFEFYGRSHTVPGAPSPRCVFAVAKPYPSRNTAMCAYPRSISVLTPLSDMLAFPTPVSNILTFK